MSGRGDLWKGAVRVKPKPSAIAPRCEESGRYTMYAQPPGGNEYDRCPRCGRVVRPDRFGRVPEHKVPQYLREPKGA